MTERGTVEEGVPVSDAVKPLEVELPKGASDVEKEDEKLPEFDPPPPLGPLEVVNEDSEVVVVLGSEITVSVPEVDVELES